MNYRRALYTALAALVISAFPQLCAAQLQQTLTCSSTNGRRQYCQIANTGVRVNRRLSEASCDQNTSWGYDNNGIWVDRGCAAEFIVNTDPNNSTYNNGGYNNQGTYNQGANNTAAQTVTCTARRNSSTHKYCAADTENASVTLQQQTSNATCTQGSTWGYDDEGIWVSSGCGGVFNVTPNNTGHHRAGGGYGRHHDNGQYATSDTATAQTIRCDSTGYSNNRQYCPVDARGGVRMSREYSSNVCRQGSNWGYDDGGVWVSNGCSADFQTYATGSSRSYSGRTTVIPAGTQVSIRADEAIDSKTAYSGQRYTADVAADVTDSNGNVIIPRGTQAELVLHDANYNNSTYPNNNNDNQNLVIDLDSVTVNGERYIVSTQDITSTNSGIGANKKTGAYVGGGAVLGALIGAIAGGGKGAAIGAAVGAGAGAGGVILTKGKNVNVPVETVLNFKLDQDLSLQAVR